MSRAPRYSEPFSWWGPGWQTPAPRGINDLLRDGTIDPWSAANLWAAFARRSSVVVISGPSGAGKTTLLSALLDFLPRDTQRIYLRGCFETFEFLEDPAIDAGRTALLINEISPHLPVYLWGPAVGRTLQAGERGFTLLATAHAGSVHEFVGGLTGSPLRIPIAQVAALEFVVLLEHSGESQSGRHVAGTWRLSRTPTGLALAELPPLPSDISREILQTAWFPVPELSQRFHALNKRRGKP